MIFCFRRKNAEKRQNVIGELVLTEKEYVRDLKITYETFNLHNPRLLEDRGIDVKVVFGNILEVCVKFLKALSITSLLLTHWHTQPAVRRAEPSMPLLLILALGQ
jgi:hypothetical protein